MLTSFDERGNLAIGKLKEFVRFLVKSGVHGLFPCSTLGEFSSLTVAERKEIIKVTIEETKGEVSVIPGTGSTSLEVTMELTRFAHEAGADGVIIAVPFYLKADQEGLRAYYGRVAESVQIPVLLYNIPQETGAEAVISAELAINLDKSYSNIVGIKDSTGNFSRLMRIQRKTSKNFLVYQGLDSLLLPSLILGCAGGMVASGNLWPEVTVGIYTQFGEGHWSQCSQLQLNKINPLINACNKHGTFPAGFKAALELRGFAIGPPRLPINSLDKQGRSSLKEDLSMCGFPD